MGKLSNWLEKKGDDIKAKIEEKVEKADEALGNKVEEVKKTWKSIPEEDRKDIKKGSAAAAGGYVVGGIPGVAATIYTGWKAVKIYKRHKKTEDKKE